MSGWDVSLPIVPHARTPLYAQIADALVDEICRGRLSPGQSLPGSRTLARSLSVHRNTVLSAYQELLSEGWITTSRAKGTFVSQELPERKPQRFSPERSGS